MFLDNYFLAGNKTQYFIWSLRNCFSLLNLKNSWDDQLSYYNNLLCFNKFVCNLS